MIFREINIAIVIIGKISSGKTTLAKFISEKYNLPIASFGGYVKNYCEQNNLSVDRKNLQDIGEGFIQKDPVSFLHNVISFSTKNYRNVIFEGVRHAIILNEIRKIGRITRFIFVDADIQTRYERSLKRNEKVDDKKTFEDFKISDGHSVEKEIEILKKECNIIIDTTKDYSKKIEEFLSPLF